MAENPLAQAERHVREGEARVAAQIDRIARMRADGDSARTINAGVAVLETLQRSLELARQHLAMEQAHHQR